MADRQDLLQIMAAGVPGEKTPVLGGERFRVDHQCVAFELQSFGQLLGVDGFLVDGGHEQGKGADRVGRCFRKQVQVIGDRAARGVDLIGLRRQFDRSIAFAAGVFGKERDRAIPGVQGGAEQFIIEASGMIELNARGTRVIDGLTDADTLFQLFLAQRGSLEPGRGLVVVHHHR
ncbi:hypothetical protein D3C86_1653240 [compost metagenome]